MHYRAVPYHNFFHVVDVTHAAFRFIRLAGGRARMSPAEKLALMVAALCHDMDHPGARRCAHTPPHMLANVCTAARSMQPCSGESAWQPACPESAGYNSHTRSVLCGGLYRKWQPAIL